MMAAGAAGAGVGRGVAAVSGNDPELGARQGRAVAERAVEDTASLAALRGFKKSEKPLTQNEQAVAGIIDKGYGVNPAGAGTARGVKGAVNTALSWIAGRDTDNVLAVDNAGLAGERARAQLGLGKDAFLNEQAFKSYRATRAQAYENVKASRVPIKGDTIYKNAVNALDEKTAASKADFPELGMNPKIEALRVALSQDNFTAEGAIDTARKLRSEAAKEFKSADAETLQLASAKRKAADALEGAVERSLRREGYSSLMDNFRAARRDIAISHDIESATNTETGVVNPTKLRQLMVVRGRPLTGAAKEIADASRVSPRTVRNAENLPEVHDTVGMSMLGAMGGAAGAALGHGGMQAAGEGAGLAMAARPAVRSIITSKPYQRAMVKPSASSVYQFPMSNAAAFGLSQLPPLNGQQNEDSNR